MWRRREKTIYLTSRKYQKISHQKTRRYMWLQLTYWSHLCRARARATTTGDGCVGRAHASQHAAYRCVAFIDAAARSARCLRAPGTRACCRAHGSLPHAAQVRLSVAFSHHVILPRYLCLRLFPAYALMKAILGWPQLKCVAIENGIIMASKSREERLICWLMKYTMKQIMTGCACCPKPDDSFSPSNVTMYLHQRLHFLLIHTRLPILAWSKWEAVIF